MPAKAKAAHVGQRRRLLRLHPTLPLGPWEASGRLLGAVCRVLWDSLINSEGDMVPAKVSLALGDDGERLSWRQLPQRWPRQRHH